MKRDEEVANRHAGTDGQAQADGELALKHGERQLDVLLFEVEAGWIDEFDDLHASRRVHLQFGRNQQRIARRVRLHVKRRGQRHGQRSAHGGAGMHAIGLAHGGEFRDDFTHLRLAGRGTCGKQACQ